MTAGYFQWLYSGTNRKKKQEIALANLTEQVQALTFELAGLKRDIALSLLDSRGISVNSFSKLIRLSDSSGCATRDEVAEVVHRVCLALRLDLSSIIGSGFGQSPLWGWTVLAGGKELK